MKYRTIKTPPVVSNIDLKEVKKLAIRLKAAKIFDGFLTKNNRRVRFDSIVGRTMGTGRLTNRNGRSSTKSKASKGTRSKHS